MKEHGQGYTTSKSKRDLTPELADTNFHIDPIVLSIILNFRWEICHVLVP